MDEFRWIQMFLCLMLMIQIAAASVNETSIFMKVGDDVTLPCLNVTDDQNNCDGTTWVFSSRNKPAAVELIKLGQISEKDKTKSDRLSVTANCSLDIKKLTVEDVGCYHCQQYKVGETQTQYTLVHQSEAFLSAITLTEHKDSDKVNLNCSVVTFDNCHHTVKWLIQGQPVDKDNNQIVTSQTGCSTTVTLLESHYLYSSSSKTVKCEVTDTDTGRVQLFAFSPQPSGNTKTEKTPTIKTERSTKSVPTPTTTSDPSDRQDSQVIWYITGAAVLAILLITVVIVIMRKKTKGNKTQRDENAGLSLNPAETQIAPQASQDLLDPEVSYATISYTKNANCKIRVRGDDEGDTVTYSTVKAPSTSAAATTDPNNLYSAVSFPVT